MGHVDFGDLKVKLLTSIVAISAIHVLESFMNIGPASDRELAWSVGILIAFVFAALLLAIMNRLCRPSTIEPLSIEHGAPSPWAIAPGRIRGYADRYGNSGRVGRWPRPPTAMPVSREARMVFSTPS